MRHVSRRISSSLQPLSRRASVWAVCSDSPASTARPAGVRRRMRERPVGGIGAAIDPAPGRHVRDVAAGDRHVDGEEFGEPADAHVAVTAEQCRHRG